MNDIARDMLDAFDEDKIAKEAGFILSDDVQEATEEERARLAEAQSRLVEKAIEPMFSAELRNYLENVRKAHRG